MDAFINTHNQQHYSLFLLRACALHHWCSCPAQVVLSTRTTCVEQLHNY